MAAASINTYTLIIPNPEWPSTDDDFDRVPSSLSFSMLIDQDIRTLSTNTASRGDEIHGLLYVPDILPDNPCHNLVQDLVPSNVTRQANLPETDYVLIALAPWISVNCTLSYLEAARRDPVRAFLFYLPDNGITQPPLGNDPRWALNDGGQWKSDNRYPVYAIPGQSGATLMNRLGRYSGNMTDVPNGHNLTEKHDPRGYVRLYTEISTGDRNRLPSLWVFLLIVLAILVVVVGATSVTMHWLQKQRREALRRRVGNGEVDLEALGIKRLKVSRDALDKMHIYLYVAEHSPSSPPATSAPTAEPTSSPPALTSKDSTSTASSLPYTAHTFSQPTCAICLDDFVPGTSTVRSLPCTHIFHPECVDEFLLNNSSLCPMCKKSVLPKGSCPAVITNSMVRRERNIRRMRERVEVTETGEASTARRPRMGRMFPPLGRGGRVLLMSGGAGGRRPGAGAVQADVETAAEAEHGGAHMEMAQASVQDASAPPAVVLRRETPPPAAGRTDWARRRANALLGRSNTFGDDADDERREARLPKWRKAVKTVFPGFR